MADTWVDIPSSSALYGPTAADLTMPTLIEDLFSATTFHKGAVRMVDRVRALRISYQDTGGERSVDCGAKVAYAPCVAHDLAGARPVRRGLFGGRRPSQRSGGGQNRLKG